MWEGYVSFKEVCIFVCFSLSQIDSVNNKKKDRGVNLMYEVLPSLHTDRTNGRIGVTGLVTDCELPTRSLDKIYVPKKTLTDTYSYHSRDTHVSSCLGLSRQLSSIGSPLWGISVTEETTDS